MRRWKLWHRMLQTVLGQAALQHPTYSKMHLRRSHHHLALSLIHPLQSFINFIETLQSSVS